MFGYYEYEKKRYYDRASFFNDMLKIEEYYSSIQFCFAEDIFRNIDWKQEVPFSIDHLYKMRALQLREKYNYLILYFSGGSDSRQILETFLKYNIHIDEIQVAHHTKLTSKLDQKTMMVDADLKLFLEYDYAVVPQLERIRKVSPKTKITEIDISDYLYDQIVNKKFNYLGNKNEISLSHQKLYNNIPRSWAYYLSYYNSFLRKHPQGTCIIRGFEKPILGIIGEELQFMFSDMVMHAVKSKLLGETSPSISIEDFFWSGDAPLIPIKQSQMIKLLLETDLKFYQRFMLCRKLIKNFDKPTGYSEGIMIERLYSTIIYPDWDNKTFAALKPTSNIPEFKLLEKVTGEKQQATNFMQEYAQSMDTLYKPLKVKKFRSILFTKPHSLGKLNFKWVSDV